MFLQFILNITVAINVGISAKEIDYFTDSSGTRLPQEMFMDIFNQFYLHPAFFLNIKTKTQSGKKKIYLVHI